MPAGVVKVFDFGLAAVAPKLATMMNLPS